MISIQKLITEIGEGTQPYPHKKVEETENTIAYKFEGKNGQPYVVKFKENRSSKGTYALTFYPGDSLEFRDENETIDAITNSGDALRVLSTVAAIVKTEVEKNKGITAIQWIGIWTPGKEGSDLQREKLYNAYVKRALTTDMSDWEIDNKASKAYTTIRRKKTG